MNDNLGETLKFKSVKKSDLVFSDTNDFSVSDDRKFSGVAYSGQPILNHPFWGNLAFEISSMTSKNKIPILFNHDMEKIVGSGTLTFTDKVEVQGKISSTTEHGRTAYSLIKEEDFPMQESVYIEPSSIVSLKSGEKVTVNGYELFGPGTIFKGGKIKEVSLTPLGADSETSTTIFSNMNEVINIQEEQKMTEEMKKFTELFSKDPEEAFKFACSCQGEKANEGQDKDKKIEELTNSLNEALEKIVKLESVAKEKASLERKEKIQKIFNDLMITLNPEIQESYLEMSDEKFSKVVASLEKDVQTKKDQIKNLTTYQEVESKTSDKIDENKIFSLAREIREKESAFTDKVASSLEEARRRLSK